MLFIDREQNPSDLTSFSKHFLVAYHAFEYQLQKLFQLQLYICKQKKSQMEHPHKYCTIIVIHMGTLWPFYLLFMRY